jgi:glucose-6-phosphate isomerase, archaeal
MIYTNLRTGEVSGPNVSTATKTVRDLSPYWSNQRALRVCDPDAIVYTTQTWEAGGDTALFWGNTTLMPGRVGNEHYMTRGHRHVRHDRGEMVIVVSGKGLLLLMDLDRKCWTEPLAPGSTHFIDGSLAHRTINTGDEPLVFLCCWPADCGHDYSEIEEHGFSTSIA